MPVCTTWPRSSTVYRNTSSRRADFGFDIARHGQVDHEHRAVAARLDGPLDQAQADQRQRRGGARDHDVELVQAVRAARPGAIARPLKRLASSCAALQRAVGDGDRFRVLRGEVGGAQFDHFAGADEQHVLVGDAVEDALRQAHGGGGHRHAVGADLGGRCALPWPPRRCAGTSGADRCPGRRLRRRCARHPSSGRGSAARPAPSNRARRRRGTRGARRRPAAACTGGDAARRSSARGNRPGIAPTRRAGRAGWLAAYSSVRLQVDRIAASSLPRGTIAREPAARRLHRRADLVGGERQLLAQRDRCGRVVQADGEQLHSGAGRG